MKHGNPSAAQPSDRCVREIEKKPVFLEVRGFTSYAIGELVCGEGTVKKVSGKPKGGTYRIRVWHAQPRPFQALRQ